MKIVLTTLALVVSSIGMSQVVSLMSNSSTYTAAHGKMSYKEVFKKEGTVELTESVNANYEVDLGLKTISYNVDGIKATKSFTSLNFDKKANIAVFTYNDEGIENSGKSAIVPVTVELNLNPGKEQFLMSWFDHEGDEGRGVTMVQNSFGEFLIN
jgi:hypothetical protein